MELAPMMSSATAEWGTPQEFFDRLDAIFHFNLDPCATDENHKCARYFTKEIDGLKQRWVGRVFMNPPYGRDISKWMEKAEFEARQGALVVCLVPARTDTKWFQRAFRHASEIVFLKGRLKFEGAGTDSAPFPSALVIYGAKQIEYELTEFGVVHWCAIQGL